MSARTYDLVLFGATGYTGGLTAEYLARNVPASTRWALAGYNRSKLETVRRQLCAINLACTGLDLLAADAQDLLPSHVQRRIVAMAPIVFRRLVVGLDIGLVLGLHEVIRRSPRDALIGFLMNERLVDELTRRVPLKEPP